MNTDAFLRHHGLRTNPFRGEEARQDLVFDRVEGSCRHPDFEKILGDPHHPAAAVVFGERGSGKTAMRLQLEATIRDWNEGHPQRRCLVVGLDEFNPMLASIGGRIGKRDGDAVTGAVTLADHLDVVLGAAVPSVVDAALAWRPLVDGPMAGVEQARRRLRAAPTDLRLELQRLQLVYDGGPDAASRTDRLARMLHVVGRSRRGLYVFTAGLLLTLSVAWACLVGFKVVDGPEALLIAPMALFLLGVFTSGIGYAISSLRARSAARAAHRRIRATGRSLESFLESVRRLSPRRLSELLPPERIGDETWRIERLQGLVRVLRELDVTGLVVLVDRVDEPVLVNGAPSRMRSLTWPLFRNKVLQMEGVGIKFLLPLELRDELMRESAEFYREARLDKQNLVDRLAWSGATLFDLCNARLEACAVESSESPSGLMDLFEEQVGRQEVVDALDQMQQPRDAFKLLYALIQEHCTSVVEEDGDFRISRGTLDHVRRRQVERRDGMLRGVRPG